MTNVRLHWTVLIPLAGLLVVAVLRANLDPDAVSQQPEVAEPAVLIEHESSDRLTLAVGKSLLVTTARPVERIAVGFGDVAEGNAVSPHEVLLNGKAPGVTSLIIWQQGGTKKFYEVAVSASRFVAESRVGALRAELERELPGQKVNVSFENDSVFLRGRVKDVTSADRAAAIASTLGKTVNLLYVDVPPAEAQILLRVKFASVDRSLRTQLGMNLLSTGAGNTVGTISTQQFSPPAAPVVRGNQVTATVADALNLFFLRPDLNLGATIEALEVKGLLQVLAEPNMLAENGKQASFLAGGEFPFPSVNSSGPGGSPTVSIQFREFGVRLVFTPVITPRGTIHLEVAPEVSSLDFTNGLSVSGFNVPALTTRKLNTQVELNEGQSFAIGGLLDNRTTDTLEKIPFIGDVPILGKLFQSKSVSKQNTELIVIVTPELVHPLASGAKVPALNFPRPFMEPNTPRDPAEETTPAGAPSRGALQETMPIEKLEQPVPAATQPGTAPSPTPHADKPKNQASQRRLPALGVALGFGPLR